jgi:Icc-related predicted phosphoesterase
MKLAIWSDLHLNFYSNPELILNQLLDLNFDQLIIAGDLSVSSSVIDYLEWFDSHGLPVIFVPGNHDYYHSSIRIMNEKFNSFKSKYVNILQCKSIKIGKYNISGCTLWFKSMVGHYCGNISDYNVIKNFSMEEPPENEKHMEFINNIKECDIMITHHIPKEELIADEYRNSSLNKYFVCYDVIREFPLWIYGHSHTYTKHEKYLCNPKAYPHEPQNKIEIIKI